MSTALRGRPAANGSVADGPRPAHDGGTRLRLYRNPLRLLVSASLWRAAWFLAGYVFVIGWVLFAVAFTATVTAAVLADHAGRYPAAGRRGGGAAVVRRRRARPAAPGARRAGQGRVPLRDRAGLLAQARARWQDPATWRDVAYLIGLWAPLFVLDTIVLTSG